MSYKWSSGTRVKGSAETVGKELERIAAERPLTPDAVLEEAESPASPLHDLFEWDDTIAAAEYRRTQAGYIVRHLKVVINDHEARAFVSLHVEVEEGHPSPVYLSTVSVIANPFQRQQLLAKALHEVEQWERRYREYEELIPIFTGIGRVKELALAN